MSKEKTIEELGFYEVETYKPAKSKSTQSEKPSEAQNRDLFQTPDYAVKLLVPFIPYAVTYIWEPACGDGKIIRALRKYLDRAFVTYQSDIRQSEQTHNNISNFLDGEPPFLFGGGQGWAIITNPPFSLKRKFYEKCREYNVPFALLIPADYSGWLIQACVDGAEKIIPTRRIDYITPSGKSGESGHTADFHSLWLTWGFGLGKTETYVELSNHEKKTNI